MTPAIVFGVHSSVVSVKYIYEIVVARSPDSIGTTKQSGGAVTAPPDCHAESETLYDQPYEDNKVVLVTGPFTVESLSPHRVLAAETERPRSEEAAANAVGPRQFETMILENLRKAGVQQYEKKERIRFDRLEPFAGLYIHREGECEENGPSADSGQGQARGGQTLGIGGQPLGAARRLGLSRLPGPPDSW